MNLIKRKYVMSLVFDLTLLLVGSGILYQLSLSVLTQPNVNTLVYVIINSLILGAVLLDIVFEYAMYRRVSSLINFAMSREWSEEDSQE
jgi:heme/copper-type cytochrome/quinol oxidase subunit 3